MRQSGLFRLAVAIVTGVVLALPGTTAYACTPPPGGLPTHTVAERVAAAPIVLEGEVTALSNDMIGVATVQVARYFKGSGPATVQIANLGSTSVCLSPVAVGERWIFYARGDGRLGMQANYLSQFDAVAAPNNNNIAQVIAASGQQPRGPDVAWLFLPIIP
jgi:hypothetical protein